MVHTICVGVLKDDEDVYMNMQMSVPNEGWVSSFPCLVAVMLSDLKYAQP